LKRVASVRPESDGSLAFRTSRGGNGGLGIPFASSPLMQVSPRGGMLASLHTVYEGAQSNTMRLVVRTAAGDTLYARNIPFIPQSVSRTARDSAVSAFGVRADRLDPQLAASLKSQLRIPAVHPPFSDLILGDDGAVWIRLAGAPGAVGNARYLIVSGSGVVLGTARVTAETRILTLGDGGAWGVERDEDNVMSVVRYRTR
jgi:hypothetical protein